MLNRGLKARATTMEVTFLTILIFFGVIVVTTLVFGVWIVATVLRLIVRGITGFGRAVLPGPANLPPLPSVTRGATCSNQQCRATNPTGARFCRRCGRELPQAQRVAVRRAAMW